MKFTKCDGIFYKNCCINCYYCKLIQNEFKPDARTLAVKCSLGAKKSEFAAKYYYYPAHEACSHFRFKAVKPYKIQDVNLLFKKGAFAYNVVNKKVKRKEKKTMKRLGLFTGKVYDSTMDKCNMKECCLVLPTDTDISDDDIKTMYEMHHKTCIEMNCHQCEESRRC